MNIAPDEFEDRKDCVVELNEWIVNIENWSAQEEKGASDLTVFIKQAANFTMLQKSFDQYLENH
jgi:hypothetical protein